MTSLHPGYLADATLLNELETCGAGRFNGVLLELKIRGRAAGLSFRTDQLSEPLAVCSFPDFENGSRIPRPRAAQQLWAQHKYSVMARDLKLYKAFGTLVRQGKHELSPLLSDLAAVLREPVSQGRGRNVLQHMWGYVSRRESARGIAWASLGSDEALLKIAEFASLEAMAYLLHSTALADYGIFSSGQ